MAEPAKAKTLETASDRFAAREEELFGPKPKKSTFPMLVNVGLYLFALLLPLPALLIASIFLLNDDADIQKTGKLSVTFAVLGLAVLAVMRYLTGEWSLMLIS